MKTVMIVEDEKPARELLKMAIDWERIGYHIIGEARDGKQALEMYEKYKPDVIITDIQMPIMDGIDLIREVKKQNETQKFVILSCHESFSYAKQAMKLGVEDYLIKDTFTVDELHTILLQYLKEDIEPGIESDKKGDLYSEEKELALWSLIKGDCKECRELEEFLAPSKQNYFLACVGIDKFKYKNNAWEKDIKAAVYDGLSTLGKAVVCFIDHKYLMLLISFQSSNSHIETMNIRYNILQAVKGKLENLIGSKVSIGVSRYFKETDQISQMAEESKKALECRVFLGKDKVLYYEAIRQGNGEIQIELLNKKFEKIKEAFEKEEYELVLREIETIYCKDIHGIMQYHYLQHVNTLLLGFLTLNCTYYGIEFSAVFGKETVSLSELDSLDTVSHMYQWIYERFQLLRKAILKLERQEYSPRVRKIILYMKENYTEDITVDTIAQEFNIHKTYLGKIFKEETGKSPNKYINELRIKKAKNLLMKSDYKISEIVYECGFNSPQNFYYVFKQNVGVNPMEYRDGTISRV